MHAKLKYKCIKTEEDIRTLPDVLIKFTVSDKVLLQYLLHCLFKELRPNDLKAFTTPKYDIGVIFIYLFRSDLTMGIVGK
jgi:hypothetical protein